MLLKVSEILRIFCKGDLKEEEKSEIFILPQALDLKGKITNSSAGQTKVFDLGTPVGSAEGGHVAEEGLLGTADFL